MASQHSLEEQRSIVITGKNRHRTGDALRKGIAQTAVATPALIISEISGDQKTVGLQRSHLLKGTEPQRKRRTIPNPGNIACHQMGITELQDLHRPPESAASR